VRKYATTDGLGRSVEVPGLVVVVIIVDALGAAGAMVKASEPALLARNEAKANAAAGLLNLLVFVFMVFNSARHNARSIKYE
jgi:hypothetical protein